MSARNVPCCGDIPDDAIRLLHRWGDRDRLARLPRAETVSVVMPEETDVRGWRVWWSDGARINVYDSRERSWAEIPGDGVQAIIVYFAREWKPGYPYRRIVAHADWYEGLGRTLTGTLIPDDLFERIMAGVIAAETF